MRLISDVDVVVKDMIFTANSNAKLIFACLPSNPTAKSILLDDVEALVDFSTESAAQLINKHPNTVVL